MATLRILSGKQIREAVQMIDIIEAMETAFIELSSGRAEMPIRSHLSIADPEGTVLIMPSYMKPAAMVGVKMVSLFEENRNNNIPYIQGLVCLFDGTNGSPRAILDGAVITALRTGAASGLATRLLARRESSCCAVFGAGVQGRTQLEAVCSVCDIERAYVFDPSSKASEIFADEMGNTLAVDIEVAESSRQAVHQADIICCATISETPVFDYEDLPPGVHINAVGSYKPHVQEVPETMVLNSRLFVDHRQSALEETGDLIIPIEKGIISEAHIVGEIGAVAAGQVTGRTSQDEITFFKSVGVAVQDCAAASVILSQAEKHDVGTVVDI